MHRISSGARIQERLLELGDHSLISIRDRQCQFSGGQGVIRTRLRSVCGVCGRRCISERHACIGVGGPRDGSRRLRLDKCHACIGVGGPRDGSRRLRLGKCLVARAGRGAIPPRLNERRPGVGRSSIDLDAFPLEALLDEVCRRSGLLGRCERRSGLGRGGLRLGQSCSERLLVGAGHRPRLIGHEESGLRVGRSSPRLDRSSPRLS